MAGVKTNVVTAIEIDGRNAADTKQLPALVATTARTFALAEVSADKGYASAVDVETVKSVGAEPFIAFRTSRTPAGRAGPWRRHWATSCTGATSSWPTTTNGATWSPRSPR